MAAVGAGNALSRGRLIMILGPCVGVITVSSCIYHLVEMYCGLDKILHLSCDLKILQLQPSGLLTDRLRVIMAFEVWDERFM